MRIFQLSASPGEGFYCENCIRDNSLVRSLRAAGHEAFVLPLYLPPGPEAGAAVPEGAGVFFGGINVYLQQKSAVFRHTPRWLDRVFDSPRLLRWAARRAGMTAARDLGESTLSMLRGEAGRQAKELHRLADYLASQRPDVVCLSNALLAGAARQIRRQTEAPVVCCLQDEDAFLDALPQPWRDDAWHMLSDLTSEIDAFVASSRYYADVMTKRLSLPPDKVHVVYPGVDTRQFSPAAAAAAPAVGFISRMSYGKGLDTLAEAVVILKRNPALAPLKLIVSGGRTASDESFIAGVNSRLAAAGTEAEYAPGFDTAARRDMLRRLSVLSVPTRQGEAFGLYVVEALACGVPVVLPRHGAFVELVEATGGGLLCEPNDAEALAEALGELLLDGENAREIGRIGRRAVCEVFDAERSCRDFLSVCETAVRANKASI